jgi:hypothetical protein
MGGAALRAGLDSQGGGCPHTSCGGGKTSETSFGFVSLMVRMGFKQGREELCPEFRFVWRLWFLRCWR